MYVVIVTELSFIVYFSLYSANNYCNEMFGKINKLMLSDMNGFLFVCLLMCWHFYVEIYIFIYGGVITLCVLVQKTNFKN